MKWTIQELIRILSAIAIAIVSWRGMTYLRVNYPHLFWIAVSVLCIYTMKKMNLKIGLPKWKDDG